MEEKITPIKDNINIYKLYFDVCSLASEIRTIITIRKPGNLTAMFYDFKEKFDLLYSITCDHNEIRNNDQELLKDIDIWLSLRGKSKSEKYKMHGIELFENYKSRLISYKIIQLW